MFFGRTQVGRQVRAPAGQRPAAPSRRLIGSGSCGADGEPADVCASAASGERLPFSAPPPLPPGPFGCGRAAPQDAPLTELATPVHKCKKSSVSVIKRENYELQYEHLSTPLQMAPVKSGGPASGASEPPGADRRPVSGSVSATSGVAAAAATAAAEQAKFKARDLSYADDGIRLRRAEQQRRRSSGEQSVSGSSVQSAGGFSCQAAPSSSSCAAAQQASSFGAPNCSDDDAEQQVQVNSQAPPDFAGQAQQPTARLQPERAAQVPAPCRRGTMLPQVTIVRSDSSGRFVGEPQLCVGSGGGVGEPLQLLSELTSDSRVQSRCVGGAPEVAAQQAAVASSAVAAADERPQQRSPRLLHDQLSSGTVPPISERLLNPSAGGGLSVAESIDNLAALIPRVRVEFYNSENTLKQMLQLYFIKDHTVSLCVRTAKLVLKVLACYLYVCRVVLDRGPAYANCYTCQPTNATVTLPSSAQPATGQPDPFQVGSSGGGGTGTGKFVGHPYDGPINFRALLWVDRGPTIWGAQTTIAVICFVEALLMQYLTYKNSIFSIVSFHFTLELVTNLPFILSIFWIDLRTLFVAGFLNCWLAKQCLEAMLNDLSIVRQTSVFSHRLTILSATVFCLIFTSACGFQHTQRSGGRNFITIFESIYFVVVTFSTVGYGDFKPETWPSQLFIMVMICVALIVLPTQFEQLAYFWIERKKLGASYAHHSTRHEKHVVVCSTTLRADTIMDFLNEFYAHPLLQAFSVVLLSPCELETTMKLVLQTPTWNNRVVYIQGSALKATDLIRARMQSAEACFILAARNYNDRSAADEHTILRSWAIRDFSPYVPQYVQIFRTENKIHVAFAEHVVCDDEFKYALLANNCLIPGTSTLVTLLLHTSQQQHQRHSRAGATFNRLLDRCAGKRPNRKRAGDAAASSCAGEASDASGGDEEFNGAAQWKRLYGKCSANEIYHIRLSDSRFFGEYQGKSFTYASFHSHRKFGVALIGVQTDMRGTWPIMLNPGPSYLLKSSDILFYINITKEENSTLMPMMQQEAHSAAAKGQLSGSGGGGVEVRPEDVQQQPLVASAASDHLVEADQNRLAQTCIRIESSSPVAGAAAPDSSTGTAHDHAHPSAADGRGLGQDRQQQPPPPPPFAGLELRVPLKKHSVADGAGIIARSLCSVAGFGAEGHLAGNQKYLDSDGDLEQQRGEQAPQGKFELRNLTARLLNKRNSSASQGAPACVPGVTSGGGGRGTPKQSGASLVPRNASTLELAALATGFRKGSNMSITSTKSREVSPTRLKQVVSGLAVKMKRVKLGKSLTHLTLPRMDLGGGSSASSTESFVNARGRRPSIAPVPAMMGESEEHDSDHEREQESYFAMSWQSSSESSPIVKKFVFCTTYVGVSPTLCYLLQRKKLACCLQLSQACEHCKFKNARQYNWPNRCIILASDFASNGIYNFLVPLRAHFHNPNELRPIVLLLERKPSPQFIDAISWFPMVYWMPGSIDNLDDLIKAGINLAHSVVVTNKESTNSAEEDYLADCNTIVAVQTMFKMFPSVGIITELSQSSNMRFMQFRAHDLLFGSLQMASYFKRRQKLSAASAAIESAAAATVAAAAAAQSGQTDGDEQQADGANKQPQQQQQGNVSRDRVELRKLHSKYYNRTVGRDVDSHAYKYRLPFAAGNVFSASMLDTLLYQAFVKDYMITMVRLLLGIDQAPGSGFLSSMRVTRDELWIRTYGRLYQRLCSTTCEIPLGIYRTEPLESATLSTGCCGGTGRASVTAAAAAAAAKAAAAAAASSGATGQQQEAAASYAFGAFASQQIGYEQATEELERVEISNMVKNRLQDLGMLISDYDDSANTTRSNTFSYVIINPNCDVRLREGDIIYLIRPSPIHSRRLFMHRANSVRHADGSSAAQPPPPQPPPQPAAAAPNASQRTEFVPAHECRTSSHDRTTNATPEATAPAGHLKSYFSDGDFEQVLIKVDQHDESGGERHLLQRQVDTPSPGQRQLTGDEVYNIGGGGGNGADSRSRRRSSCSDAEDSKRSSLVSS